MRSARMLVVALLAVLVTGPAVIGAPALAAVAPGLASVTLTATDVVGGTPVGGTVTLTAAAPSGGTLVDLSSDNPAVATVPAGVTVPAGATAASFQVTTYPVTNSQSALIIGTAGGVTTYAIVTVRTQSSFSNGSISVLAAGSGRGTVTSEPAGINCAYDAGSSSGTCSAFFPAGTVVRLTARAGAGSKFQGWRGTPGCGDPSRITVARGTTITCQPGFTLR
ncbi:MAG: hypothetical protein ABIQ15_01665 [Nocardioides sp.]